MALSFIALELLRLTDIQTYMTEIIYHAAVQMVNNKLQTINTKCKKLTECTG